MVALNDDCLEHIFKMLPIGDRINMLLSYQPFSDILAKRLKIDYKSNLNTRFFNTLQTFQLQVLLSIIGAYVKNLKVELPFEEESYLMEFIYFKLLLTYCSNVESLKYYGWSVNDETIKSLSSLKRLKSLALINNPEITGNYLCELKGLQELSLNNCTRIKTEYFEKIFQNLKYLKILDIRNCNNLSSQNYQTILENLKQLETLKMSTTEENYNSLAKLPNLRNLEIRRNNIISPSISKDFLHNLVKFQAEQLQELQVVEWAGFDAEKAALIAKLKGLKILHCKCNSIDDEILEKFSQLNELEELNINNCYFISNRAVLEVLRKCLKIKRLHLSSCGVLTTDVVPGILHLLKHQHQIPTDRLQMVPESYKYSRKISDIAIEDSSDVLKLSYKYITSDYEGLTQVIEILK
ncbi:dynein regulatory complex subunit 6-like [Lucilia sericata]|uniref:dynein regulatory complex subunit 6-like n=1 Tax=Lucilia sericata TaxID=13632 RepID=UPI0018A83358|nr:dynein regulatory complex subunit 6-like [Lucilia sericata]